MRKEIKILLAVLLIGGLWFTSCKNDDDDDDDIVPTELVINAKKANKDSAFYEGTFIRLYENEEDMYNGQNIFLEGETSKDMDATVSFKDIAPGMYYIHAAGSIAGGTKLERYDSVEVVANTKNVKDIILKVVQNNGNLKVFARKGINYFEGAIVKLYLSDQERDNSGTEFLTTLTESHGSAEADNYAFITNLDPQKYYIFVTTEYNGKTITGIEDGGNGVFVPKAVTINSHVQLAE
jgi:hypothetical protein